MSGLDVQAALEGIARDFNMSTLCGQGLAVSLLAVNKKSTEVSADSNIDRVLATFFELRDVEMEDGVILEALGKCVNVHGRISRPVGMQVSLKTGLPMRVVA